MTSTGTLVTGCLLAAATAMPASAQQPAGDRDDQLVITGCVMQAGRNNTAGPRSLLVWSDGDIYLDESTLAQTRPSEHAVGTAGSGEIVLYWLDDDDDFAVHAGKRVEIVGDMSEVAEGEIEVDRNGPFTEFEFEVKGRETTVQVPTAWLLLPDADAEFDVLVRTVDVEQVTVLGACRR